jgi:hypothetical protein
VTPATRTRRKGATKKRTATTQRERKGKPKASAQVAQVRTSERASWNACRQQWEWGWVKHLKPRETKPALRFGSLIHEALEMRYPPGIKRGPLPAESFEKLYIEDLAEAEQTWGFRADDQWEDALDVGVDMMERYIDEYGKDEDWKVIASEMTFQVPVFAVEAEPGLWVPAQHDTEGAKHLFDYVGTMDGVWENRMDGGIRVNDYKTCSGDPVKEAASKFTLDEQTTAYWTWGVEWLEATRILSRQQMQKLDGMLFTFMRKAKSDPRPQDAFGRYLNKPTKAQEEAGEPGDVSKSQPPPYFHREVMYRSDADRSKARQRAIRQFIEMDAAKRHPERLVYKQPGTGFPRQVCVGCEFRDMCELHEIDADWESQRDATMTTWDPYDAHEVEQEGKSK